MKEEFEECSQVHWSHVLGRTPRCLWLLVLPTDFGQVNKDNQLGYSIFPSAHLFQHLHGCLEDTQCTQDWEIRNYCLHMTLPTIKYKWRHSQYGGKDLKEHDRFLQKILNKTLFILQTVLLFTKNILKGNPFKSLFLLCVCLCVCDLSPIFFMQSPVNGHSSCFHVLAITSNAAMNRGVCTSLQINVFTFLGKYPKVALLDHMVFLFFYFFFKETPYCFPQWFYQFTIPPAV